MIGGYQNLEKSCLKSRGTPKGVKVCFDEAQLERVCEYPSETYMLTYCPYPEDKVRDMKIQVDSDGEEEESEVFVSRNSRGVGAATGRALRVDESCPW